MTRRRLLHAPTLAVALAVASAWTPARAQSPADAYVDAMAREHAGDRPVAAAAARSGSPDSVEAGPVVYTRVEGREVEGYLATPADATQSAPGVVVIHEWWGLNDNIRTMARMLAARGYAALAVDLYEGRVASTPDSATKLVQAVDEEAARTNLRDAHAFLADRGSPRVASLGWCFGGGWSLRAAFELPEELDAAVIYYGQLVTDASELDELTMPVQGHFGAEDNSIPLEEVSAFEEALGAADVPNEIYVYEGAGHAFANPSGERYVPEAARTAWARTIRFLAEHLKAEAGE